MADAGADRAVSVGATVELDGSGSTDSDGDALGYDWSLLSRPAGSAATLSGGQSAKPSFSPDVAGVFEVSLVVSDGSEVSAPDMVSVTAAAVEEEYPGAECVGRIDTGIGSAGVLLPGSVNLLHGMAYCDGALYVTSSGSCEISKILPAPGEVETGYPRGLYDEGEAKSFVSGVAFDPSDGSMWVYEINSATLRHYDVSLSCVGTRYLDPDTTPGMLGGCRRPRRNRVCPQVCARVGRDLCHRVRGWDEQLCAVGG